APMSSAESTCPTNRTSRPSRLACARSDPSSAPVPHSTSGGAGGASRATLSSKRSQRFSISSAPTPRSTGPSPRSWRRRNARAAASSERLPQSAGAFKTRMAHGQLPHAQAVGLETAHQRIVGDHSGGGMAAAGEPATEDGEDIARAAPEPARREERNPQLLLL